MATAKIWSRFSGNKKKDGKVFKFRIQEADTDQKEDILEFLRKYYIVAECYHKSAGIPKSDDAVEEILQLYGLFYDKFQLLLCYDDDNNSNSSDNIVGVSMMQLEMHNEAAELITEILSMVQTPEIKRFLDIARLKETHDSVAKLGVEMYYTGRGVAVKPAYSGLGIAQEFLKLRRLLCKEHGVPLTWALMTSLGSQKAAERDGWETFEETSFEELGRITNCTFVDPPPTRKLMVGYPDK